MEVVKKIELVFENCEVVDITKAVGDFNIEGITTSINRIASNAIGKGNYAPHVSFQIYHDGEFSGHIFGNYTPYERIKRSNDITGIAVTHSDGRIVLDGPGKELKELYYPSYSDNEMNEYQTMIVHESGDLFIVIDENKKAEDVYTEEIIAELISAKDLYMDEDVQAKNELKKLGWEIVKNDESITLKKDPLSIKVEDKHTFFTDIIGRSMIIGNKNLYEIASFCFDTCLAKNEVKVDTYKHIKPITETEDLFFRDKEGDYKFEFKNPNGYVTFTSTNERLHSVEMLPGKVVIDVPPYEGDKGFKMELSIEEMICIMWILLDVVPEGWLNDL